MMYNLKSDEDIKLARKLTTSGFDCSYGMNQFNHRLLLNLHIKTFSQLQTVFAKSDADIAKREKIQSLKREKLKGLM